MSRSMPQPLPPKMAQKFADRAKSGEGENIGSGCVRFKEGREEITLLSIDPPIGHMIRVSG